MLVSIVIENYSVFGQIFKINLVKFFQKYTFGGRLLVIG